MSDFYSADYCLFSSRVAFENMQVPVYDSLMDGTLCKSSIVLVLMPSFFNNDLGRKRDWCLICEFERLIRKGQEMNSPLSPVGILSQIQRIGSHLSHGREEDAHDFLR